LKRLQTRQSEIAGVSRIREGKEQWNSKAGMRAEGYWTDECLAEFSQIREQKW